VPWRPDVDADWDALRRAIAGRLVLPGSPDYDLVRRPFFARFQDVRPKAVVLCESPSDVAETLAVARRSGLETAIRSGGHCFVGRSSSRGVVIDVTPMRSVSVSSGVATVGAGARLGDVYDSLGEHGLTVPAGSCPSVGIAGLTLGGGLGILGRKWGLTSDHLLGAEVVLADGRVVECSDDDHEDLFWALRGAGSGNFGIVTSFLFRTRPASSATNFHLAWPFSHAADLVKAWQAWAPSAPDELYCSLLLRAGGDVERPPVVDLFGSMLGSEQDTAELLHELLHEVGDPTSEVRRYMSFPETTRFWATLGAPAAVEGDQGEQQRQEFPSFKSEFFRRPLPTEAIADLLASFTAARVPGQSRELDFTPWGGAYNRTREDATSFVHRNELFSLKHTVIVDSDACEAAKDVAQQWLRQSWTTVRPHGSGRVFPSFPDPDLEEWRDAYYGANCERLVRIKRTYDPENAFHFDQSLSASGE
jgi:FAD/FMN-containing dehydrogenase